MPTHRLMGVVGLSGFFMWDPSAAVSRQPSAPPSAPPTANGQHGLQQWRASLRHIALRATSYTAWCCVNIAPQALFVLWDLDLWLWTRRADRGGVLNGRSSSARTGAVTMPRPSPVADLLAELRERSGPVVEAAVAPRRSVFAGLCDCSAAAVSHRGSLPDVLAAVAAFGGQDGVAGARRTGKRQGRSRGRTAPAARRGPGGKNLGWRRTCPRGWHRA